MDAVEFETASNDKISSVIDCGIIDKPLRSADDPRITKKQSSSTTLEPRSSFEITPFTRLIPFADEAENCSTEASSSIANGLPADDEPDKLVIVENETTPSFPDANHVVTAMGDTSDPKRSNVDWMSSARSTVRQKPVSIPSNSCPP